MRRDQRCVVRAVTDARSPNMDFGIGERRLYLHAPGQASTAYRESLETPVPMLPRCCRCCAAAFRLCHRTVHRGRSYNTCNPISGRWRRAVRTQERFVIGQRGSQTRLPIGCRQFYVPTRCNVPAYSLPAAHICTGTRYARHVLNATSTSERTVVGGKFRREKRSVAAAGDR